MTDPKRLAELGSDAPEGLRTLLRAGREDLPGAARLQGLATRLGPLLGAVAIGPLVGEPDPGLPQGPEVPAPDPSAAASSAAGSSAAVKALGIGTAVAVLVGGAWLLTRPDPAMPAVPAVSAPAVEPQVVQPAPQPAAPVGATSEQPSANPEVPEAARTTATGPSESALLAQAQAALSNNPARALALTREHKRRFPNGALAQEREVIAIEALNRSGDSDAARKRASDFEDRYPGSAHRRKVQNATKP